jgi:putative ABC transport system permease protein
MPIRDVYVGNVRPYVLMLFAAVVLVLLIACGNTASLLLSRALARDREMAIRQALGAGRGRLIGQVLMESVLLALAGGVVGLALAYLGIELITRLVRVQLPEWMRVEMDVTTLLFLFGVSLLTGVLAGVLPALRSTDAHLHGALKEGTRGSSAGARNRRLRHVLVVAEVALALVLLIGASLMAQSFVRLQRADPGFEADGVLSFRVELGWRAYNTHEQVIQFNDRILDQLRAVPGVVGVTLDSNLPISGKPREPFEVVVDGQGLDATQTNPFVNLHTVSPEYFHTMGIALERGRGFTNGDVKNGQQVTIVSRRLAERLWPSGDALGKVIRLGKESTSPALMVIGVASDVRGHRLAGSTTLDVYRPFRQSWAGGSWFIARTRGVDPMSLAQVAPRIVPKTDPNQSFFDVQAMSERIHDDIWQQRASGALFGTFALLALVLAVIGLYGALSHMVAQQRRDIGVRLAIGAEPRQILRLVVGRGLVLTASGVALGVAAALMTGPLVSSLLFDVRATDPLTFVAVPLLFLGVAIVSCYIPARRAARVDPVIALRADA